jgi:hypothetical protein
MNVDLGQVTTLQESLLIRVVRQGLDFGQWFFRELLWPGLAGIGLLLLLANQAHAQGAAEVPQAPLIAAPLGPEVGPLAGLRAVWVGGCVTADAISSVRAFEVYAVSDLGRGSTGAVQALVQIVEQNVDRNPSQMQSPPYRQSLISGHIEAQQVFWGREGLELLMEGRNIPRQILRIPRAVKPLVQMMNSQNRNVGLDCRLAPL